METKDNNTLAISIILPVYNGMKYLQQSVQSVLNQGFKNFELLIVDDCSSDDSWNYLKSLSDDRINVWRNEQNKGLFYNLNFLIKKSKTGLIKLWSQDDIMEIDCIAEICMFHKRHPQIGFSYTDRNYINAEGFVLQHSKEDNTPEIVLTELHTRIAFITGSIAGNIANVTLNKSAIDLVGLFNENMKISGDFEMWVRIAQHYEIGFLQKKLIKLRNHKEQLSSQEKYFIYHLKEDIIVYNFLFSYISPLLKKEGIGLLRKQKLLFYYTLMLKAFLKGNFLTAGKFIYLLNKFDNIFIISYKFFTIKLFKYFGSKKSKLKYKIKNTE